jgi:TolB protein
MRMSAQHTVLCGLVAAVTLTSFAAAEQQPTGAPPRVRRVAQELLRSGARSAIVFVSDGGKTYAATAGARHPRADQRFRVGSVTKTFTAAIVVQLAEERKLRLASTLDDHLPGVVARGDEITIRQLLGHRSGLPEYLEHLTWLKRASRSPKTRPIDILRFAGSKPLAFKPGSRFGYSNTNYVALGLVIEKVTGRSYARELERRILRPLALVATELPKTRRLADLRGEALTPPGTPKGPVSEVDWLNPNISWAAGGIVSNVSDLSRFYTALLSARVLSRAFVETMKKGGLGIASTQLPCGRSWGHGGSILDYVTLVGANENGKRVAVVSIRTGGSGNLPVVERALLCAEPRRAPDPARPIIAFVSANGGFTLGSPTGPPQPSPLYVANADGRGQRWLTLSALPFSLAWSPDGRKIAFESDRDGGFPEIYVVNADGSAPRNLTHNPAYDGAPARSPDGRRIVFGRGRDIYAMNTDGRAQRRLTHTPDAIEHGYAWSPDGERIAFARGGPDVKADVYVMNVDGSGQRRLTHNAAVDNAPAWSPDGQTIAFTSDRDGNREVYVMNADGSCQRNLTRSAADDESLAWSPDGRTIVFSRSRGGDSDVYVMNADGSPQLRLTRGELPRWSPDGRTIAFVRDGDIYVMTEDGRDQRNLTRSAADESLFAWSPTR